MNCSPTNNSAMDTAFIAGVISVAAAVIGFIFQYFFIGRKLEKFKSELSMKNKWDEIRLIKLREEQGVIYKEVYERLVTLFSRAKVVSHVRFAQREHIELNLSRYWSTSESFSNIYETKKIWLNDELCALLDNYKKLIDDAIKKIEAAVTSSQEQYMDDAIVAAWDQLVGEIKTIKTKIEGQFKSLMHV